jgi:Tfp pilus assembly protein PilN
MDRTMLLKHLALAEVHVTTGARNIARQKKNIAELEAHGANVSEAERTLAEFQDIQAVFLAEHQRIREALEQRSHM